MSVLNQNIKDELTDYLNRKINQDQSKALIISTYKLSSQEIAEIKESFPEIRKYSIENAVDNGIIGGFIIKYGSYIVDLSIRGRLNNFKKLFYEIT